MPGGEQGTGWKSLTSLDTDDSTVLWKIAQSDQKEACVAFRFFCFPARVMKSESGNLWYLVCCLRMLRQYPTQMFNQTCHCLKIKRSVMDAEMPRYIKCCSSISANPRSPAWGAIVQSGRGINGRALVLFSHPPRQVLHSPSDLVPAKWGSASIALLNFHPSSWMISPVVSRLRTGGGCFFCFV